MSETESRLPVGSIVRDCNPADPDATDELIVLKRHDTLAKHFDIGGKTAASVNMPRYARDPVVECAYVSALDHLLTDWREAYAAAGSPAEFMDWVGAYESQWRVSLEDSVNLYAFPANRLKRVAITDRGFFSRSMVLMNIKNFYYIC